MRPFALSTLSGDAPVEPATRQHPDANGKMRLLTSRVYVQWSELDIFQPRQIFKRDYPHNSVSYHSSERCLNETVALPGKAVQSISIGSRKGSEARNPVSTLQNHLASVFDILTQGHHRRISTASLFAPRARGRDMITKMWVLCAIAGRPEPPLPKSFSLEIPLSPPNRRSLIPRKRRHD